MSQRVVPAILIALLLILHAQLWFGRGSLNHGFDFLSRKASVTEREEVQIRTHTEMTFR